LPLVVAYMMTSCGVKDETNAVPTLAAPAGTAGRLHAGRMMSIDADTER